MHRTTVTFLAVVIAHSAQTDPFVGPFTLNDGITFYVVNPDGESFRATVRYHGVARATHPQPCLIRLFDPQEELVGRHEFEGEELEKGPVPWDEHTFEVPPRGSGVYQIRVNAWGDTKVDLQLDPEMSYGVHGHLQWVCGTANQFADAYFHLPPKLKKLPVNWYKYPCEAAILDQAGTVRLKLDKDRRKGEVALPSQGEHVWRLKVDGGRCMLNFKGLPIVLCPDEATARAIKSNVEVLPDGTICFHKYQVRAHELLQRYRKMPASAFDVPIVPLEDREEEWMREPVRNQALFGLYGLMATFPGVLHEQNLDPTSHWFGSIAVWKDKDGAPRTDNPLTTYNRLGMGSVAALAKNLGALYWLDEAINPYHKNEQLLKRVIIGSLQNLMYIGEGEHMCSNNIHYYGHHAFNLVHQQTGAFPMAIRDCPADVKEVWTEGLRRYVDRMVNSQVGGCTNQWVHLPEAFERFYWGTGEEWYREVVLRHMRWINTMALWNCGQRKAGYMTEATGPDATYNGLMTHYAAAIYHRTRSPEVLDSIRRCFSLFNHTIARESDGKLLGSSSYCCRTPGDWSGPQYGAGFSIMGDDLPEAAVREGTAWGFVPLARTEDEKRGAQDALRKKLRYAPRDFLRQQPANRSRASGAFDIFFPIYLHYPKELKEGCLPCEESESFAHNFGDEFYCIKRPTYYAFVYAGVAQAEWLKARRPRDANHQFQLNDGGICLFWSKDFGTSILSKNWSAFACNTAIAWMQDGRTVWPDYWSVKRTFDAEGGALEVTSTMIDLPVNVTRSHEFLDDRIECRVELTATKDTSLRRLVECIPYPPKKENDTRVEPVEPQDGKCSGVSIANDSGKGHTVLFEQPQRVDIGLNESVDHYKNKQSYGRVLVELPTTLQAGQTIALVYQILPR